MAMWAVVETGAAAASKSDESGASNDLAVAVARTTIPAAAVVVAVAAVAVAAAAVPVAAVAAKINHSKYINV